MTRRRNRHTPEPTIRKPPEVDAALFDRLVSLSNDELAQFDLVELNLICAAGLPGAENLAVACYVGKVEQYALQIKKWIEAEENYS